MDRSLPVDRAPGASARLPLALIAATARGGVIGRAGRLPFDVPEDRRWFLAATDGHAVIMGRKTFDETGRPLPGRRNLVVSRSIAAIPGAEVHRTVEDAIAAARRTDPMPFVIGGAEIFRAALPHATRVYLTEIDRDHEGDTVWNFDRAGFREIERRAGEDPSVVFLTFERER
jgi:dihydrofolate reductase